MKKIILKITILILVFSVSSCRDEYLNVNTDPNNPVSVTPELILPVALRRTAQFKSSRGYTNLLGNLMVANWSQSEGFSWYPDEFNYTVTSTFYDQIWNNTYRRALKQYSAIDVANPNFEYYQAIAKIMKSYHFQVLVDIYGDLPYFEALQRGANATPAFDSAQVIYEDLIVKLDEAIALINSGAMNSDVLNPGTADALYSGNMNEWKKFANTLKLRILVRQSDMTGRAPYISTQIAKINAEGSGYITADALSNLGYTNQEGQQNPFWGSYGKDVAGSETNNNNATCATPFVLNTLMTLGDSRIDFIYEKPATGHLGVTQGFVITNATGALNETMVSNIGPGLLKSASQDAVIFSMAELNFLLAEAAMKGLVGGSAQTYYEAGITASFNYLGAPIASYLTNGVSLADWNSSPNKMEAIMTQKWIALNGLDAIQSWFDYSRTGYPTGLPVSLQASTPERPVRLQYTAAEISSNGANVPSPLPNNFTDKIFWAN